MTGINPGEQSCSSCGKANEAGMRFCMFCGEGLSGKQLTSPFTTDVSSVSQLSRACPKCGKTDELNNRFCVFCGSDTGAIRTGEAGVHNFLATRETSTMEQPAASAAVMRKPVGMPYKKFAAAAVVGLIAGYAISFLPAGVLENSVVRSNWPSDGLVLYVSPGNAQVLIENESGRSFTLGRTSAEGTLSIPDLPPGNYSVTVSAPGYVTRTNNVRVDADEVSVLGYPDRMQLSRDVVSTTNGSGGRS
jgi:hypothetical protein